MPIFREHPAVDGGYYLVRLASEPRVTAAVGVDVTVTLDKLYVSGVGTGTTTVTATIEAKDAKDAALVPGNVAISFLPTNASLSAGTVTLSSSSGGTYIFTCPITITLLADPNGTNVSQNVIATVTGGEGRSGRGSARFFLNSGRPGGVTDLTAVPWIRGVRLTWSTPQTYTPNEAMAYYLFRKPEGPGGSTPSLTRNEVKALIGTAQDPADQAALRLYKVTGNSFFDQEDDYTTTFYYWLISVDLFGNVADFPSSPMASASPGQVIDDDFLAGSIDIATIAARDSVPNALAAGTITTTKLGVLNAAFDPTKFTNNSPSTGFVSWSGVTIVRGSLGSVQTYTPANGNTDKEVLYWQAGSNTIVGRARWDKTATPTGPGTIAVAADSTTVTGTGTTFNTTFRVGDIILIRDGRFKITAIGSNTSMTVDAVVSKTPLSGQSYKVQNLLPPFGTYEADFIEGVDLLLGFNKAGVFKPSFSGTYISGDYLQTGRIEANKIDVTTLSALTADIGDVRTGIVRSVEYGVTTSALRLGGTNAPSLVQNSLGQPLLDGVLIPRVIDLGAADRPVLHAAENPAGTGAANVRIISVVKQQTDTTGLDQFYVTSWGDAFFSGKVATQEKILAHGGLEVLGAGIDAGNTKVIAGEIDVVKGVVDQLDVTEKLIVARSGENTDSGVAMGQYVISRAGTTSTTTLSTPTSGAGTEVITTSTTAEGTTGPSYTTTADQPFNGFYTVTFSPCVDIQMTLGTNSAMPNEFGATVYVERSTDNGATWSVQGLAGFSKDLSQYFQAAPLGAGWVWAGYPSLASSYPEVILDSPSAGFQRVRLAGNAGNGWTMSMTVPAPVPFGVPPRFRFRIAASISYSGGRIQDPIVVRFATNPTVQWSYTGLPPISRPAGVAIYGQTGAGNGGFLYLEPNSADPASGAKGEFIVVDNGSAVTAKFHDGTNWIDLATAGSAASVGVFDTPGTTSTQSHKLKFAGTALNAVAYAGTASDRTATITLNSTRINGNVADFTLGTGLSLSGNTINATATGGVTSFGGATGAIAVTAGQFTVSANTLAMASQADPSWLTSLAGSKISGNIAGNAGSATQLLNSRTLWGQSFNGTANVSGNMTGVGTISANDGSAGAPAYAFTNETNAGLYRISAGVLGISTASGLRAQFDSTGVRAADFTLTSDRRLKEELTPLSALRGGALAMLDKVDAYHYFHTQRERYEVGVVAQEVREVLPEAVFEGPDGMLVVAYDRLIPLLLAAVKELKAKVGA